MAGSDDFVTKTIRQSEGRHLVKVGAEGMYCGVLPEKGLAFALKSLDGHQRAASATTAWLLSEIDNFRTYSELETKNWRSDVVGKIVVSKASE